MVAVFAPAVHDNDNHEGSVVADIFITSVASTSVTVRVYTYKEPSLMEEAGVEVMTGASFTLLIVILNDWSTEISPSLTRSVTSSSPTFELVGVPERTPDLVADDQVKFNQDGFTVAVIVKGPDASGSFTMAV